MNDRATKQTSCQMKSIVINNMKWIESITKRKQEKNIYKFDLNNS